MCICDVPTLFCAQLHVDHARVMKLVDMRGLKLRLLGGPGSSPGTGIVSIHNYGVSILKHTASLSLLSSTFFLILTSAQIFDYNLITGTLSTTLLTVTVTSSNYYFTFSY